MASAQPVRTVVTDRPNEAERPITHVKVSPAKQVWVRAFRTWLQTLAAMATLLLGGALLVDLTNWERWLELPFLTDLGRRVLVCLLVATATALVSAAHNAYEFVQRIDATNPESRA